MPEYIASGSHTFKNTRYRFLILPRYEYDLQSIIKNRLLDKKTVLIIAGQILDILEYFHDKGYVHSDIKAENLMIGKCTIKKPVTDPVCSTPVQSNRKKQEFSGTNPIRSCRKGNNVNTTYKEMLQTHYLRPPKKINYSVEYDSDDDFQEKEKKKEIESDYDEDCTSDEEEEEKVEEKFIESQADSIFLIDFGLASKFLDSNGSHRPFCMDQRRAHDGTLEYTSRDAHMGAHSRRSDLECLGYNLIYWLEGFLPWKDENLLNLPEQVHRMKEIFMADIQKMLKLLYSNVNLEFIAEFMKYVANLDYDERPDYDFCRKIFLNEFSKMGFNRSELILNLKDIKKKSKKSEIVNSLNDDKLNFATLNKMGFLLPFKECTRPNKVSPKNLRSKSDKIPKKNKSKLSWNDLLSTDPDQIAKQRADKEFEREEQSQETPTRYKGKPTYAILEIENKLKFKDKLNLKDEPMTYIKGYTKPMMDILRKRQLFIMTKIEKQIVSDKICNTLSPRRLRAKDGSLRSVIKPTRKILDNQHQQLSKTKDDKNYDSSIGTDESSCSSTASSCSNKKSNNFMSDNVVKAKYNRSSSSSGNSSTDDVSDDESMDLSGEYTPSYYIKKFKKKIVLRKKLGKQIKTGSRSHKSVKV